PVVPASTCRSFVSPRTAETGGQADGLGLQVLVEALGAVLAADAGLLVAPEGEGHVEAQVVHAHGPRPDAPGDLHAAGEVGAEHAGREAEVGVVGDPDGLVLVV